MKNYEGTVCRESIDTVIENVEKGQITRPGYILKVLRDLGELKVPEPSDSPEDSKPEKLREAIVNDVVKNSNKCNLVYYARFLDRVLGHRIMGRRGVYYED